MDTRSSFLLLAFSGLLAGCASGPAAAPPAPGPAPAAEEPEEYRVYVANESSDVVSRVRFAPGEGAELEGEIPVGIMPADTDGPHGIAVSPDGEHLFVSIAHGTPFGSLWKYHAGPDTLIGRVELGRFPATIGVSPSGSWAAVVNFNLHGDMVPSDVSVVHVPSMREMARVRTCLMPHGSRVNASGTRHYSVCMHSDQLVELDLGGFEVSGRFSVAPGAEEVLPLDDLGEHAAAHADSDDGPMVHVPEEEDGRPVPQGAPAADPCSPTWVTPARGERADRFVYVACNGSDEILEIDVRDWGVTRRWETGAGPYNLDVSPDGRRLVATLKGDQAIEVFDLGEGERLARLETSRPVTHGVVIAPDGRYVFISNESVGADRGTLDVFDLDRMELVSTLVLQHQPGGIDFWSGSSQEAERGTSP